MPQDQIDKTKGNLSLIPQVFYDIIARIIPGLIIIFVVYFIYSQEDCFAIKLRKAFYWYSDPDSPKIFLFLSFMLTSYIISTVIGQFAVIFEKCFKKILNQQFENIKEEVTKDFNKTFSIKVTIKNFPSIAIMYDYVRLYEPGAGNRLVKLRAECHMCRNITCGLLLILVLTFILKNIFSFITFSPLVFFIVLASIISLVVTYYQRRKLYLWGLCNHWILIRGYYHLHDGTQSKIHVYGTDSVTKDDN